jgi:hypothetical protein
MARLRRGGIVYHVEVEGHFYSVPYRFARSEVEVRLTGRTVEIFVKGERIWLPHIIGQSLVKIKASVWTS